MAEPVFGYRSPVPYSPGRRVQLRRLDGMVWKWRVTVDRSHTCEGELVVDADGRIHGGPDGWVTAALVLRGEWQRTGVWPDEVDWSSPELPEQTAAEVLEFAPRPWFRA